MKDTLLQRLQAQPFALHHLLFQLSEEEIKQRPIADKWSIFENLAHLARYQQVFVDRMRSVVKGDKPTFQPYKADNDEGFFEWQKKPYNDLMAACKNDRDGLNNHLGSLPHNDVLAVGYHPVYGAMNVEGWTEFFLLHEAHHFFTILKLAAVVKPGRVMGLF